MPKRLITLTALLVVALSTTGYAQTRTEHFAECRTQHPERFARSRLLTEATLTDPDFARIERRLERLAQRQEDCATAWEQKVAAAAAAKAAERQSSLAPSPPPLGRQGSGSGSITQIICSVFGAYCSQALAVAGCESGFSVTATNGQYFGLFQMGTSERAAYGGSSTDPWEQTRAAYSYFVASGSDWSPWQCKP